MGSVGEGVAVASILQGAQGCRIIKKYPNRRLYDTTESKYITLGQIREMVCKGIVFRIVDTRTAEDLTRVVLLQVLMELENGGQPLFTADMLLALVRQYGAQLQSSLSECISRRGTPVGQVAVN